MNYVEIWLAGYSADRIERSIC